MTTLAEGEHLWVMTAQLPGRWLPIDCEPLTPHEAFAQLVDRDAPTWIACLDQRAIRVDSIMQCVVCPLAKVDTL